MNDRFVKMGGYYEADKHLIDFKKSIKNGITNLLVPFLKSILINQQLL